MGFTDASASDTSNSAEQPIKHAPVVYGRSSRVPLSTTAEQQQSGYDRVHHISRVPSRQRQSSACPSDHVPDNENSRSSGTAHPFQFDFRHRLKELDEEFDDREAQSYRQSRSPSSGVLQTGSVQVKDLQNVTMGTTALSSEAHPTSEAHSPAPFHATSAQGHPPETCIVQRRTRRVQSPVPSDSEAVQSDSSSVSPVRHAITTPHSRSSPTPPTSGEFSMVNKKSKGKAPARDVLPLLFDGEQPLASIHPTKSKKKRQSEPLMRPKTKAPTKKERREAAFESSRIAANRPVEVIRTQEQKHTLSAFFAGLRRDNIVTPTLGTELPSDPIEKFSSPIDCSTGVPPLNGVFGAPTGPLGSSTHIGTSNQPFSSEKTKALPPAAGDSGDEMPSAASIIQQAGVGRQRLWAMKRAALQHADTTKVFDINSEDDDLLVIKDDMHAVAREEAIQRRLGKAHGSPVKNIAILRRINHPSVRPAIVSPHRPSKQELQELAKPSFAREGKSSKGQFTKKQLDELMIMQHSKEQLRSIKRHEEEWIKGGGKLSRDTGGDGAQTSLSQKLEAYAKLGLKVMEIGGAVEDEAGADESDEDYNPDLQGSATPESRDADEDDVEPGDSVEFPQSPQPSSDEEEAIAPFRRNKSGQRHSFVVGSDDEGEQPVRSLPSAPRDSASSMESQTEDENDKENSAKLMYDRGEDKENKAVVRHELSFSDTMLSPRLGSLHGTEDIVERSFSIASAKNLNDTTSSPKGGTRSPLKDISKDEDDLFLSPPANILKNLLHNVTISPPNPSTSTLSLGSLPVLRNARISRTYCLSLNSENDEHDPSRFRPLQPPFLERLRSQFSPEPSLASINPLPNAGFSQLFSAEDRNLTKPVGGPENDELSLTFDVGLKPALEVSETLRQKAEVIFEKEQEYVVAAAVQSDRPKELLYVNDHGFLTQTRPEDSSSQVYRMTPSQASGFAGTQVLSMQTQPPGARLPLRTLSITTPGLSPEPHTLTRLRRRSPSPLEQKLPGRNSDPVGKLNAFNILGKVPESLSKAQKEKPGKSEFVADEAEESDEDGMFGFGGPKKDDEEGECDNEQDKVVEGLVDDTAMDAETEAADLVLEKHREHEEEDDQRLQKLHQDAIEGKFRMKRRDRGVGFEDDSDDDDDDDDARCIRRRIHKKRKIEGDSLEALGQNQETRAFYNTYHQDLIDEDNEFGYLQGDMTMPATDDDTQAAEPERRESVSMDEIRQRVREVAQNKLEVNVLDPEDTSWIEQSMMIEADDTVRIKVIECQRSKYTAYRPNAGQMDFDVERPKPHIENEQERKQLTSWAKNQGHWYQGTGRSGNSTAVTGHTKVKAGGGSLRSTHSSNAPTVSNARKTKKTPSLLSTVSNREDKFK